MEKQLGCEHYDRGCKFIAPCCNKEYWCRHCHNKVEYDEQFDPLLAHRLVRTEIKEIVCGNCDKKQGISNECIECGLKFGEYYCEKCRFYDNTDKGQFHCDGCGICRQGGKDNFFHCDKCVACLPLSMKDSHKCLSESLKINCPVCMEYLMDSTKTSTILKCGHTLHTECQRELLKNNIMKCPQCNESMIDMKDQWEHMDMLVEQTTMPENYQNWKVKVLCSDCHKETENIFHVIGIKCLNCGGYNTRRIGNEPSP